MGATAHSPKPTHEGKAEQSKGNQIRQRRKGNEPRRKQQERPTSKGATNNRLDAQPAGARAEVAQTTPRAKKTPIQEGHKPRQHQARKATSQTITSQESHQPTKHQDKKPTNCKAPRKTSTRTKRIYALVTNPIALTTSPMIESIAERCD